MSNGNKVQLSLYFDIPFDSTRRTPVIICPALTRVFSDMSVIYEQFQLIQFKPSDSPLQSLRTKYQLADSASIQSVFYAELVSQAVASVKQMKQGDYSLAQLRVHNPEMFPPAGSWPTMEYTKCAAYTGEPILRTLNIKSKLGSDRLHMSSNGVSHFKFPVDIMMHNPGHQR